MDTTQTFGDSLSTLLLHTTEIHVENYVELIIADKRGNQYHVIFDAAFIMAESDDNTIINPQRVDVMQTKETVKYTVTGEDDYSIIIRLNPMCAGYEVQPIAKDMRVTLDNVRNLFDRRVVQLDKSDWRFTLTSKSSSREYDVQFPEDMTVNLLADQPGVFRLDESASHDGYITFRSDGDIALTISYDPQEEHYMQVKTLDIKY